MEQIMRLDEVVAGLGNFSPATFKEQTFEQIFAFVVFLSGRLKSDLTPARFLIQYLLAVDSLEYEADAKGQELELVGLDQYTYYQLRTILPAVAFAVFPKDFAISVAEIRAAMIRNATLPPPVQERHLQNATK